MLKDKLRISNLQHKEHLRWLKLLDYYEDQIRIFQQELLLTFHRHTSYWSILEHVQEYRRIFLKKLESIDELRHQTILREKLLTEQLNSEEKELLLSEDLPRKIEKFNRHFDALKISFRSFIARNS